MMNTLGDEAIARTNATSTGRFPLR